MLKSEEMYRKKANHVILPPRFLQQVSENERQNHDADIFAIQILL